MIFHFLGGFHTKTQIPKSQIRGSLINSFVKLTKNDVYTCTKNVPMRDSVFILKEKCRKYSVSTS